MAIYKAKTHSAYLPKWKREQKEKKYARQKQLPTRHFTELRQERKERKKERKKEENCYNSLHKPRFDFSLQSRLKMAHPRSVGIHLLTAQPLTFHFSPSLLMQTELSDTKKKKKKMPYGFANTVSTYNDVKITASCTNERKPQIVRLN